MTGYKSKLRSPTIVVAIASTIANLLGYAFNATMSRALSIDAYGELAALLAVVVVATVPGTALQAVIARRMSATGQEHGLLRATLLLAAGVGVGVALIGPGLRLFLGIGTYPPVLWTAASLVPTTIAFGWQGILQGARRFSALGFLLMAVQLARVLSGLFAALTHTGASGALAITTLLTTVVVVGATPLVQRSHTSSATEDRNPVFTEIARDISPILGVLVLTNLDLLLARHYLPPDESGLYAAGNLLTRAAFWGPAFVVVVAYPRLSVPAQRSAALARGVRLLAVMAIAAIVASVVAGGLVSLLLGDKFAEVADYAWVFTIDGLALAAAQFAVFAGLAVHDRRLGRIVWIAAASECGVVAFGAHGSLRQIITVATLFAVTMLVVAIALELRRPRISSEPPAPAEPCAPSGPSESAGSSEPSESAGPSDAPESSR